MSATTKMSAAHAWMKGHVGLAERPAGTNIVPLDGSTLWKLLKPGFEGQPWCAATVTYAYLQQGVDLRKVMDNPFYCPYLEAFAKKIGAWKTTGGNLGDLVLYGTNVAVHVGMASPADGTLYYAFEGNTSPGNSGSQANGGGLYYRGRPRAWIRGWVDMRKVIEYMTARGLVAAEAPAKTAPAATTAPAKGGYVQLIVTGKWDVSTRVAMGKFLHTTLPDSPPADFKTLPYHGGVRALQTWCGTKSDGFWGPATTRAIQRKLGVGVDGGFGPTTIKALQEYLNRGLKAGNFRV